jgi:tetratricopeptide (TPR) repeat protein
MEQLEALQKLYESIFKGPEVLQGIEPDSIVGKQAQDVAELVRLRQAGREWDSDVCGRLVENVDDVECLLKIGNICQLTGHWNEAVRGYERVLEKTNDDEVVSIVYNNLGLVYADKGEWDKAIEFYEKSLETKEKVGDVHGMARTYNNLGLVYADKGEWDKTIEFYDKSLETFEKVDDVHGMAQTYGNLGIVYARKGEWDKAIEFYEKSLETKEKVGNVHGMAQTYNNLGLVYADKGEWDKAIEFYEKDLKISEKVGDVHGMAQTYGNLGIAYARKGEWDKAIEFYEKYLKILEKVGDVHGMAQTYGNLGLVYADKGEWDKAIKFYEKNLETFEKVGDVHGMGVTYSNIGKLYLEKSKLQQAKENLEKSIKLINLDARPDYPNAMNWLALCYIKLAEQKKSVSINDTKNRKNLIEKASAYYICAAEKYRETYHLYLARMPESLLADSHIASALSIAVLNPFIKDDKKAIEGLDSAVNELETSLQYADDVVKTRIEGSILGFHARKNVRMVNISDNKEEQDELLNKIILGMKTAAKKFEETGDKEREMDCKGCACLYEGLQHLHNGLKPDNPQEFMRAREKFRESEECYSSAGSKLGTEIIKILNNELTPKMEELLDYVDEKIMKKEPITRRERQELFSGILNVLEQVSFSGLSNLFHAYIFDPMLDYKVGKIGEKENIPQLKVIPTIKEPIPVVIENPPHGFFSNFLNIVLLAILIGFLSNLGIFYAGNEFLNQYQYPIVGGISIIILIILSYQKYQQS